MIKDTNFRASSVSSNYSRRSFTSILKDEVNRISGDLKSQQTIKTSMKTSGNFGTSDDNTDIDSIFG